MKIQVSLKPDQNEGLCTVMTIFRSFLLRMSKVSNNSCLESSNTLFMANNFFSENRALYEIMWKNMVEPNGPQVTI